MLTEITYSRQKVTFELFWIQICSSVTSRLNPSSLYDLYGVFNTGFRKETLNLILMNSNVTFSLSPSGPYELYDFLKAGFWKKTLILILMNSNETNRINVTAQKMKFWSHLLKKSLMENFIFFVQCVYNKNMAIIDIFTYLHWKCANANKTFWIFWNRFS